MFGLIICTLIVCATIVSCVLGWKYLDDCSGFSSSRLRSMEHKISNIENILESGSGGKC